VPKITLTEGSFGQGPAAADLAAFHLPDPARPGATLVVPFTDVAEMAMVRGDNGGRIRFAIRTGLGGLMSAGPVGLSAALLAAGKAPQTVFSVRLSDGRGFTALAEAQAFADMHAAYVEARSQSRGHPADMLIARYLAERGGPALIAAALPQPPEEQPAALAAVPPDHGPAFHGPRPARPFGRRTGR